MIKTEYYEKNGLGVDLYRTYSDENKMIRQIETGIEYAEAIDVGDENGNISYTYEETDIEIEKEEMPEEIIEVLPEELSEERSMI